MCPELAVSQFYNTLKLFTDAGGQKEEKISNEYNPFENRLKGENFITFFFPLNLLASRDFREYTRMDTSRMIQRKRSERVRVFNDVKQKKRRDEIKVSRSWHGNPRNNGNKIYYCQRWSGYVKTELIRGEDDTLNRFCDISPAPHYSVLVLHFSPERVYSFFPCRLSRSLRWIRIRNNLRGLLTQLFYNEIRSLSCCR